MTPDDERLASYLEHGSWPDPDRGGSPGEPGPDASEHGEGLPAEAAVRLRNRLADADVWAQPPEDLLERIVADVEREPTAAVQPGQTASPEDPQQLVRGGRRRHRLRWGIAAVATAAIAAEIIVGVAISEPHNTTEVALAGTQLAAGASATASVRPTSSGLAITLDVSGLPPSAPGFFYQAWMKGTRGLVSIGTFHMRGGPSTVTLWSGVSLADYPTITVTREPEDGNPASSGQVVLTNRL
jgi:Anti-sigma-K factor rskA